MRRLSVLSLLCFAVLLASSNSAHADSTDDPTLISIDVENGASTMDTITFTGVLEDEVEPSEFFWRVAKNGSTFDGGDLKSSFDEIDSTSSRPQWSWSFDLSFDATGECACYVSLHSKDASGTEKVETRVVFMVDENTTHLLGFLVAENQAGMLVDGSLSISGWIGTYLDDEMTLGIQSSLAQGLITASHIPDVFACVGSSTAQQVTILSGGDFEIDWDISSKLDGWLDVELMACSLEQAFSDGALVHYSIRVNNAPPIIKLDGIDSVEETNEWHTFDASMTEDPYWGRTDMYYVWTLRRPSHTGTIPVDVQMGDDLTAYSVSATSCGNFTLSLTVYDQGGLSSTRVVEFDIHNRVPTASLSIDGIAVADGEEFRLKAPSNTLIDATLSTDTENDAGTLRCIWLFDGALLYEGCNRDFVWPDESIYRAWLTLEVIDDDGEIATLSVQLVHPDEIKPFPVFLIGLVFSALFLTYAIAQRLRGGSEKSIPKWKS